MTASHARIARSALLPDAVRVARCRRVPELGPRILFFSGGSALRALSRSLKSLTHNSVHLITPFDSGGSSARLREAFAMLSVGDLRNRLLALADETVSGAPEIYRLFSHRLPAASDAQSLERSLDAMVRGTDRMVADIPAPLRRIVRTHLRTFAEHMPRGFDLRGASIGNLVLAGGYFHNDGDIESVLFLFSRLVKAHGVVRPIVTDDLHLVAMLDDGSTVFGQHRITGKDTPPPAARISELALARGATSGRCPPPPIDDETRDLILDAELIVFPMGSFYSSVVANLLPQGVGRAVLAAGCPRVYVPNTGLDPEQIGMSVADAVERLVDYVRRDTGGDVPAARVLDCVLVDRESTAYGCPLDFERIGALGIEVVDVAMVGDDGRRRISPDVLAEVLVSFC